MKNIISFEQFVLNEAADPRFAILDNRGAFDRGVFDSVYEEALYQAYKQNRGFKDDKEADKNWNDDLDDRSSDVGKQSSHMGVRGDLGVIRELWNEHHNVVEAIRICVIKLEELLNNFTGDLSGATKTKVFLNFKKEALAYAAKAEKENPMTPVEFVIEPGVFVKDKGIRAKEYFEAGQEYFKYETYIIMDDGSVLCWSTLYDNLKDAQEKRRPDNKRLLGPNLEKVKEFYRKMNSALERVGDNVAGGSSNSLSPSRIEIFDHENQFKKKVANADKFMRSSVVPALLKQFPTAKATFL